MINKKILLIFEILWYKDINKKSKISDKKFIIVINGYNYKLKINESKIQIFKILNMNYYKYNIKMNKILIK